MKQKHLIRLAVVLSVILLCTGFGVYSYFWLNAEEHRQDFNLYTLVPQDAIAVLETDHLGDLVTDIERMPCSRDGRYLYVSDLFVFLKNGLATLLEEAPHGLSVQMDKMLLSFHEPDDPTNQVLYCAMGKGDYDLIESFIKKFSPAAFPSKYIDYKGEEIRIYPLSDGDFLAVCLTREFLIASLQKRLVEKVIDAYREKRSLHQIPSFRRLEEEKRSPASASLFLRMNSVDMGNAGHASQLKAQVGGWTFYELKLDEEAIYCSGTCRDADSTRTFVHMLRRQKPVEIVTGAELPESTIFYHNCSLSDKEAAWNFFLNHVNEVDSLASQRWLDFVDRQVGEKMQCCLFTSPDQQVGVPAHALLVLPLQQPDEARHRVASLALRQRADGCYILPDGLLFSCLSGFDMPTESFVAFHKEFMLVSNREENLHAYLAMMERNQTLEASGWHKEMQGSLSSTCRFLMVADMERLLQQPEAYMRLLPRFFLRHPRFFSAFTLAIQFTYSDDTVYPNLSLFYHAPEE